MTPPSPLPPAPDSRGGGLRAALVGGLLLVALGGAVHPIAATALARALFPRQAEGSLIVRDGRIVGTPLAAQPVRGDAWFHPRPSACGWSLEAASGSNLAPSNPELAARHAAERGRVALREGASEADVPADLVSASGSGVDPHVSPEAALLQAPRVARARGLDEAQVRTLVLDRVERPTWGVLGRPRVNVPLLNVALETLASRDDATRP